MKLLCALLLMSSTAFAQPDVPEPTKRPVKQVAAPKKQKEQEIVVGGMTLPGKNRRLNLLYFLERTNEELERASLEKRSFIPAIAKTVEDEAL